MRILYAGSVRFKVKQADLQVVVDIGHVGPVPEGFVKRRFGFLKATQTAQHAAQVAES